MLARERFAELVARPDEDIDLAEAALWIAAENDPRADVAGALAQLDALAEAARPAVAAADGERQRIEALNHRLFEEERFRGSREDYYDPRNSFLHEVLERRTGIPITLSIVFVEVARRLGFDAAGVGFPGHFLAVVRGDADTLIDAFEGRIVSEKDCEMRLRTTMGASTALEPSMLEASPPRQILLRVLNNLKQIYLQKQDWEAAVGCCDRMLLLAPDAALELRDRGLLYQQLECFAAALEDLERFLELLPRHESASRVRAALGPLREKARQLH